MAQTKLESAVEVVVNVLIGYVVATASQILIFPLFGIFLPLSDNLLIGAYFTAISIVRGDKMYLLSIILVGIISFLAGRKFGLESV